MGKYYSNYFDNVTALEIKHIMQEVYPNEEGYDFLVRMLNNEELGTIAKVDIIDRDGGERNVYESELYDIVKTYYIGPYGLIDMNFSTPNKKPEYIVEHRDLRPWFIDFSLKIVNLLEQKDPKTNYLYDSFEMGKKIINDWSEGKTPEEIQSFIAEQQQIVDKMQAQHALKPEDIVQ